MKDVMDAIQNLKFQKLNRKNETAVNFVKLKPHRKLQFFKTESKVEPKSFFATAHP